jgi:hypothetical protein
MEVDPTRAFVVSVTVTMLVEVHDPSQLAAQAATDERSAWAEGHQASVQLIQHAFLPMQMLGDLQGIRVLGGTVEASRAGYRD